MTMPTRVLIASNMIPAPHNPAYGVFVQRHVEALAQDRRFAVELVGIADARKGLLRSPLKYARFFARLGLGLARFRPHVVHYHYALPTALLGPWSRPLCPYVVTVHGGDFYEIPARLPKGRALLRAILGGAAHVVAVGSTLAADVTALLDGRGPPVSIIDMGVDVDRFRPAAATGAAVGAASSLSPAPLSRLAFVGQLIDRKGVDLLLRAVAELRRTTHPHLSLKIIGAGAARAALLRLAATLGIADAVQLVGQVRPDELPSSLADCGTLVVPSRREPLGLVALEGMALGLVVIAARVGGLAEIVRDGVNGHLFTSDDAGDLAACLRAVQSMSAAQRFALTEAAQTTAAEHSLERQVGRVAEILLAAAAVPRR